MSVAGLERLLIATGSGNDRIDNSSTTVPTADHIETGAGNDTLDGGLGADTLIGGTGNDLYVVDHIGDRVTEIVGGGTDTVQSNITWTLQAETENLTLTGSSAINGTGNAADNALVGNSGVNSLIGAAGQDTLDGGAGADTLSGGVGNDVYVVDDALDVVIELAAQGTDEVRASVSWTLGANVENLTLTGSAAIDGTGNTAANRITGNAAANTLTGSAGSDTLSGGAGNDLIHGDGPSAGAGDAALIQLNQSSFNATAGVLTFDVVGQTNPTYSLSVQGIGTVDISTGGWFTGQAGGLLGGTPSTQTLVDTTPTDNSALTLDPSATAVQIYSDGATPTSPILSGQPQFFGTIAAHFSTPVSGVGLTGGYFDAVGSTTIEAFDSNGRSLGSVKNTATGIEFFGLAMSDGSRSVAGISVYLTSADPAGFGIDNLTFGSVSSIVELLDTNDQLYGDSGNDTLLGGLGNDTLDGGTGNDSMVGGIGDDTYIVDSVRDVVVENTGGGYDRIYTSVNLTLAGGSDIEQLVLAGTATVLTGNELGNTLMGGSLNDSLSGAAGDDSLAGGSGADTLQGGSGRDTLNGGSGADSLSGGLGNDTYYVDNVGDVVTESSDAVNGGIDTVISSVTRTLGNYQENLTLSGTAAINGTGNALGNVIKGNAAANVLNGKAGADTLSGGLGNDTYYVDNVGDVVAESSDAVNGGIDTVISSVTRTLGNYQENLTLSGTAAINGTGNALGNVIKGNAAANVLNGKAGADTLSGGLGNDTYYVDNVGDVVAESSDAVNGGIDTVISSVTRTLGNYQENLTLSGSAAIDGTGNSLANVLVGNSAANRLAGGSGNDSIGGGSGNDTLEGGSGADTLVGGSGQDTLTGGTGNDLFVFTRSSETATTLPDVVTDFARGYDRIDLSLFDGNVATTGTLEDFTFIGTAAFSSNTPGQLRYVYDSAGSVLTLYGSNDADTSAEFAIQILGVTTLSAADFIF